MNVYRGKTDQFILEEGLFHAFAKKIRVGFLCFAGMPGIRIQLPLEPDLVLRNVQKDLKFSDELDQSTVLGFADGTMVKTSDKTDAYRTVIRGNGIIASVGPTSVRCTEFLFPPRCAGLQFAIRAISAASRIDHKTEMSLGSHRVGR